MTSPAWAKMLAARGKKEPRKRHDVGPTLARAGDVYESECGCRGPYRTGERGRLVWVNSHPCKAHTPPYDPSVTPKCEPVRRVQRAPPPPADSLWALPCRVCEAADHDSHDLNCVFWVVSDHVPF